MLKIYNNLRDIETNFDVFIFDAYGVFYNGSDFYAGAREYMNSLVARGKTVVVLSNSSAIAATASAGYAQKGLKQGLDYNFFITSGQVCYEDALTQSLPVVGSKFFLLGEKCDALADNAFYTQVSTPEEADFVFISIPYLTKELYDKYFKLHDNFLPAKLDIKGEILYWDTKVINPFLSLIEKCVKLGLPAINANPDFYASEKHIGMQGIEYVVRNGLLAEYYRRAGGKTFEYGKPYLNVYEYLFRLLDKQGVVYDKARMAMIGDTVRTDVKGALNSKIKPVLCVDTGVTSEEILQGRTLEDILSAENINPENLYIIRSVA